MFFLNFLLIAGFIHSFFLVAVFPLKAKNISIYQVKNISNKLSKPKIWRVNPQKLLNSLSKSLFMSKKYCLLMNSNSLGLMTYCSLAKELMGIKNSTHKLKYSIFTQNSHRLQLNHFKSFLSQTSLSKLNHNI